LDPSEILRHRIVGTAGHIDHGKSALVRALTGTDPDRPQEEKDRGITIDLGFADLRVNGFHIGFIDVPGHERFVKNMLAGIGGIDAVMLVVAADESVMPQTREHFAICQLLGIEHGVIAITKCDLVDEELIELVELEIHDLVVDTPLEEAPIVRTSAQTGQGLDTLRAALAAVVARARERPAEGIARLPIDRVFSIRGFGTVVTGTLLSGGIAVGQAVQLQPTGLKATIRGIQIHGQARESAASGQRVALNLQGVQVSEVTRGMVLGDPGALRPSYLLDARLELLPGAPALGHLDRVRFHHGAAEILARVAILGRPEIAPGTSGEVQLRLESPYPVAPGDRFIIRRYSPVQTIGGGTIVDPDPVKRRHGEEVSERFQRLAEASDDERLRIWLEDAGTSGLDRDKLRARLARPTQAIDQMLHQGEAAGALVVTAGAMRRAISARHVQTLEKAIRRLVHRFHEQYPLRPGMPKEELRSRLEPSPRPELLEVALRRLEEAGAIEARPEGYSAPGHRVRLSADAATVRDALLQVYENAGLAPPPAGQALAQIGAPRDVAREVQHYLLRQGQLIRVRNDLLFHAEALQRLTDGLVERFPRATQFSVAEFKDWTGVSRKHAIPLLEYLDTCRITRRVGDRRERL